jgi:pyruvate/2-oxoglutarate/acetoin dehydrogenase E1 component
MAILYLCSLIFGVQDAQLVIDELNEMDLDIDLIDLRTLNPLDMDLFKTVWDVPTNFVVDESTKSGGVGTTIFSRVCQSSLTFWMRQLFDCRWMMHPFRSLKHG